MQFPSFGKCKKSHCFAFVESSHARLLFALCVRVEHGSTLQGFIHAWRGSTDKVMQLPSRVEYNKPHCLAFVESSHARLLFALCARASACGHHGGPINNDVGRLEPMRVDLAMRFHHRTHPMASVGRSSSISYSIKAMATGRTPLPPPVPRVSHSSGSVLHPPEPAAWPAGSGADKCTPSVIG